MDDVQLGELIGTVKAIKENTDKIPQLAITVARHEDKIASMYPRVESHENTLQKAFGIAAFTGALASFFASFFRG